MWVVLTGSMAVLRNKVGEHYREGLSQVVAPNNHPKLSDRVNNNISRMYAYSGNHVMYRMVLCT